MDSPAQLSMGRNIQTTLPVLQKQLTPNLPELKQEEVKLRLRQKRNFDGHHNTRRLPCLEQGRSVWIPDCLTEATVVEPAGIYTIIYSHYFRRQLFEEK